MSVFARPNQYKAVQKSVWAEAGHWTRMVGALAVPSLTNLGYHHQLKWIVKKDDLGNPQKDGFTTAGAIYVHDDKDYNAFKEFRKHLHNDVFGFVSQDAAWKYMREARNDYLRGIGIDPDRSNSATPAAVPIEMAQHYQYLQPMHKPETPHYVIGTKLVELGKMSFAFEQAIWSEYLESLGEESSGLTVKQRTEYKAVDYSHIKGKQLPLLPDAWRGRLTSVDKPKLLA